MVSITAFSYKSSLSLFSATTAKTAQFRDPLKMTGSLEELAAVKVRNDKVQAAYKLRNDGLKALAQAREDVQNYEDTYEGVMRTGKLSESQSFWSRVDGTARSIGEGADKWLQGTKQLIELGEISPYTPELARETKFVWELAGSLLGRIGALADKGLGDSRTLNGVIKNISDIKDLTKKLIGELDGKFRSFISLYLNRSPQDILAGRVDFWV
ncbi:hypothetical protein ACFSM5_16260 [Lacibacterium aquatile]|uniref:Uncharacterized protein n=1 Tax=Lacibacterium aquatile TaxID=1168082 RepID=A0ABW5DVF7_9PROT